MDDLTFQKIRFQLLKNKSVFQALLEGLTRDEYLWRPSEGKWNLLEILCHLLDEEREDFKLRMLSMLNDPKAPLHQIDPEGWVKSRDYASRDYYQTLIDFLTERGKSIIWLDSLEAPKWDNAFQHPKFGTMSAALFYTNWLAHDQRHIEQIIRMKYGYLRETAQVSLDYAG